jgi:hypothetical protein
VHAADAAGAEEPDAERAADRERAAHGRRPERALNHTCSYIPGAHLARTGADLGETLQVGAAEPGPHGAVDDADRGGYRPGRAHPIFRGTGCDQPSPAGEAVRNQRGLQRHDRLADPQRLGDLLGQQRGKSHGIAPIVATARAAACRPSSMPPTR